MKVLTGDENFGSRDWFEENKNSIDYLTKAYKEKGMSESKARYKATRELLEESYRRSNSRSR